MAINAINIINQATVIHSQYGSVLERIEGALARMTNHYERAKGARDALQAQKTEALTGLQQAQDDIDIWEKVRIIFAMASDQARQQLKIFIEETVTRALQVAGFPGQPRFKVLLGERAGSPAAEWRIIEAREDGSEMETSVEDSHGGGLVDVVSLALRLALLQRSRPKPAPLIILDEPAKHVSAEYAPNVAFFLKEFCAATGVQAIMVTHNETLADMADTAVHVSKPAGGPSEVKQVD